MLRRSLPVLPGSSFLRGAHHPHCERHANHLLHFRGRPLCLGCCCMWSGVFVGVLTSWAWLHLAHSSLVQWILIHVALVGPTCVQPWLQRKPFKVLARFALGFACATWFLGAWIHRTPWPATVETLAYCLVFAIVFRALTTIRERVSKSPCDTCPLGVYPTCSWNLPRLLACAADPGDLAGLAAGISGGDVAIVRGRTR